MDVCFLAVDMANGRQVDVDGKDEGGGGCGAAQGATNTFASDSRRVAAERHVAARLTRVQALARSRIPHLLAPSCST